MKVPVYSPLGRTAKTYVQEAIDALYPVELGDYSGEFPAITAADYPQHFGRINACFKPDYLPEDN